VAALVLIFLWPAKDLASVQISIRQRITLITMFCLGVIICIAGLFRVWYVSIYVKSWDFLCTYSPVTSCHCSQISHTLNQPFRVFHPMRGPTNSALQGTVPSSSSSSASRPASELFVAVFRAANRCSRRSFPPSSHARPTRTPMETPPTRSPRIHLVKATMANLSHSRLLRRRISRSDMEMRTALGVLEHRAKWVQRRARRQTRVGVRGKVRKMKSGS
jgi:hypothetical protein